MKDRLFRGYGPLIGFTAVFLAVVLLVPSKVPEGSGVDPGDASGVSDLLGDGIGEDVPIGEDGVLIDPETGEPIGADGSLDPSGAAGADDPIGAGQEGSGGAGASGGGGNGAAAGGAGAGANSGPTKVAGCGSAQVPGDPYSPPCIQFSGSNGGATTRGVSADKITLAVRIDGFDSGLVDAVTKSLGAAGKIPSESRDKVDRTIKGLVEYFNKRFQFYGRKLDLVVYDGKGDPLSEIIGQGQEGAKADALKVAKEYKAFADVSAVTAPYAASLAGEGVINIGAPYVPRSWLAQRRPYSWTPLTDCSTVVESTASYYAIKMARKPAKNAGGTLKDKPRRLAVIAPDNAEYQGCVNDGIKLLNSMGGGADLAARHKYQISTNPGAAVNNILPKLRNDGITTVLCGCDPVFLNFLTTAMNGQKYFPEMIVAGVALVDTDLVGQLMQQSVWSNAFGISYAGPTQREGTSIAYRAYKSVRPDEPSVGVELIYNQLYLLAIGIQGAGPNLNPQTFEKAMLDYPRRSGPSGTWGFGPGDYTTSDDAREVFWNPSVASVQTRSPGTYQDPNGGKRFPIGQWPNTPPRSALG